jgi:hypothetical protein
LSSPIPLPLVLGLALVLFAQAPVHAQSCTPVNPDQCAVRLSTSPASPIPFGTPVGLSAMLAGDIVVDTVNASIFLDGQMLCNLSTQTATMPCPPSINSVGSGTHTLSWTCSAVGVGGNGNNCGSQQFTVGDAPSETGWVNPKYLIVGVTYAPPGAASDVTYQDSVKVGTSKSISHSFTNDSAFSVKVNAEVKAFGSKGEITGTSSTEYVQKSTDSSSVTLNKTTTQSDKTKGPADSFVGVDHDYDLIWLWLNPVAVFQVQPDNPHTITWNGFAFDPADQPEMEIFPVPVGVLNGDFSPVPSDIATRLARAWAAQGKTFPPDMVPGLTADDFATILQADPFWMCTPHPENCPKAVDPTRFTLTGNQNVVYEQAPVGGQPITQTYSLQTEDITTQGQATTSTFSQEFSVEETLQHTFFFATLKFILKESDKLTWETAVNKTVSKTTTAQATATVTGPTCTVVENACSPEYVGPPEFTVYQDNQYGTFMFFPVSAPNFIVTVKPPSRSTPVGGSVTYTVSTTATDGFTGDISFGIIGNLPAGVSFQFSSNPAPVGTPVTLTVSTSATTPAGKYPFHISGTSGTLTNQTPATLVVQDFSVSVVPTSQTIAAGEAAPYQVTVTPLQGLDVSKFTAAATPLPPNTTQSQAPNSPVGTDGTFTSTLTLATSPTTPAKDNNNLTVNVTVAGVTHGQAIDLNVTAPPALSLTISPDTQTTPPGSSVTYQVCVQPLNGFSGSVSLSESGLPAGAAPVFNPSSLAPPGCSTLTVTVGAAVQAGGYQFTATATNGTVSGSAPSATLIVSPLAPDFTIFATPSSQTIPAGGSTHYTVTVTALNGFSDDVHLLPGGVPSGVTVTFVPDTIHGSGTSTMTVTTTAAAHIGSPTLTIKGLSGSIRHNTTVNLTITSPQDFTIQVSPSGQGITVGSAATYTTTITALAGFSGTVNLAVPDPPTGATWSFDPPSVTGSGSSTLTVSTSSSTPVDDYVFTIVGTSGSLSHSVLAGLTVNDFTLSAASPSQSVAAGGNASYTVSTAAVHGFNGSVGLSVAGLPAGASVNINPGAISGAGSATIAVTTAAGTAPGSYPLNVSATSGGATHTTALTLVVNPPPDFALTATPATQTTTAGVNVAYTVSTTASNGFAGTVSLLVGGLPAGATASFSPASLTGAGSSNLIVSTPTSTPAGTYPLTITGTSGSLTHGATVSLVVNAFAGPPTIQSLSSDWGPPNAWITIRGANFGASKTISSWLQWNGFTITPAGWSDTALTFTVPDGLVGTGNFVVTVAGRPSNSVAFTMVPRVTVSPGTRPVGTLLTLGGQHFGATQGASTVTFGSVAATPTAWSDTSISVPVPSGLAPGLVALTVTVQGIPNATSFTVTPGLTAVSPGSGSVGAPVTLTGTGFGAVQGGGSVWFGSKPATVTTSWSDTTIAVQVPAGAVTGNVMVCPATAVSPYCSNGVPFTVQ